MSEQSGGELHENLFPYSQPTFLHVIIPSWQLNVSMHQTHAVQPTCQIHGQNDNSVLTVMILIACLMGRIHAV